MITADMLGALKDDELHWIINHSQELLKKRDGERKAKALVDARALQAKAQSDARTLLESVGLSLQNLSGKAKGKTGRKSLYKAGCSYQHPSDKSLIWKANGQKPKWLRDLETRGEHAIKVRAEND